MSVQAMAWALRQQIVTQQTRRHVLLALANYADADGKNAFPGAPRLARETGLSERAVMKYLRELEDAGVIARGNQAIVAAHISRGDRRPVLYDLQIDAHSSPEIHPQRGEQHAPREGERPEQESPRSGQRDEQDSPREGHGVNLSAERGEQDSGNPPLTHHIKTTESDRGTPGARGEAVDNPPPDLGGFRLACRCPDFEQAALAFIASKGRDTWLSWFGSAGLTGADPPCLELPSQFAAAHVRTHFLEFFETRLGRKITIKVKRARRAQGTGRAAGPQRPAVRQSKGGRYAAR